jgi:hypothetical protein
LPRFVKRLRKIFTATKPAFDYKPFCDLFDRFDPSAAPAKRNSQ